jgi:membrane protein implicated in regulation of membrane protease activity
MIHFVEELWQSVFTPGTTPALILATHVTFVLLVASLLTLIFLSNYNIHLIALLFISLALWGLLTWFIAELETHKSTLKGENTQEGTDTSKVESTTTKTSSKSGTSSSATQRRSKRKV